jgi:hypothetical protein
MNEEASKLLSLLEQYFMESRPIESQEAVLKALEDSYREGYADAITNYAVWHDGKQTVGVMARPLKEVIEEVREAKLPIRY